MNRATLSRPGALLYQGSFAKSERSVTLLPVSRRQPSLPRCVGQSSKSKQEIRGTTPLCDIPSGCCFFTGPWTVTRSSFRMLRRVAAFCRLLRPVLLLVSFPRLRSPVVGVLGLC